jgi:hydrogenase nickel incorporation protein HypB
MTKKIKLGEKVLSENDKIAAQIRLNLKGKGIKSLNIVSSPGSGKTSLLEKTIGAMGNRIRFALIAGDVQTENDAARLLKAGGKEVKPIVTGGACHLDAKMISIALDSIDLDQIDLLIIENVGNLVCPSSFDLGEDMKVVIISTTEGDDKPLKYPSMFRRSSVMVINKVDLLGLSDFELARVKENALKINSELRIFETSCRTGEGLEAWYEWLESLVPLTEKK